MSLKRNARAAAILHTQAAIADILQVPVKKRKHSLPDPVVRKLPTGDTPFLLGIEGNLAQVRMLRDVTPTMLVTRRDVYKGQCMICMTPALETPEMALFTGNGNHSGLCPLTQPGSICFSCMAGTLAAGWNETNGEPSCPCCRTPVNETTVIRLCVR